jgi:PAS domain S-box-containing protein
MKKNKPKPNFLEDLRKLAEAKLKNKAVPQRQDMDIAELVTELRTHQIELEMQNEQLRQTQIELEESRSKFSDLFDFAPVGYFVLDKKGLIVETNLTGASLLSIERSRLIKRPLLYYVDKSDRDILYLHKQKVFTQGQRAECEIKLVKKDKTSIYVHLVSEPVKDADGKVVQCRTAMTDIAERKRVEDTIGFLAQCGSTTSGEDFFQSLARYLAQSLGMDFVCIDRLQEGSLAAQTVAVYFDGKFEDNVSYILKDTPCGDVVEKTICCFPRDVRHLFPDDVVLQKMLAESYVGTILWNSQGQPIGLIAIIGRKPLADPKPVTSILQLVALRAAGELERRQAEEQLKQINEELNRSNTDLYRFAYVASHDLREPLRAIEGFVKLLQQRYKDSLDEKANEYINYAANGAKRMEELLTGLLAYSRVQTHGKERIPMPAQSLLNAAVRNLQRSIAESNAAITADPLPEVKADGMQLTQLFQNLIQNAIKFKSDKRLEIHVGCRRNDNHWLFSVRDNGIGIDHVYHERIFTIFHRVNPRDKNPGQGIGLSICKRIVERHGGKIWVESEQGKGATFYFTIPDL